MQPVDAPVIDPFRPPEHPYGPGNRGLEYGVEVGQRVGAVAAGQVSFAGPVGGRHYAVVDHGAGLRSTYGPLVGSAVVRGQRLSAGEEIGGADAGFHLTARRGDRYVDPAPLLAGDCGHARLVSPPEVPAATSLGVVAPLGAPR
jgi:murein DD-endopeptidase MepM/ murein hydrolase activator NlpD